MKFRTATMPDKARALFRHDQEAQKKYAPRKISYITSYAPHFTKQSQFQPIVNQRVDGPAYLPRKASAGAATKKNSAASAITMEGPAAVSNRSDR